MEKVKNWFKEVILDNPWFWRLYIYFAITTSVGSFWAVGWWGILVFYAFLQVYVLKVIWSMGFGPMIVSAVDAKRKRKK